jgi:hypothetical protein
LLDHRASDQRPERDPERGQAEEEPDRPGRLRGGEQAHHERERERPHRRVGHAVERARDGELVRRGGDRGEG